MTWAKKLTDYPATDPAHPERSATGVDGKTTYSEGVNVGYRWFDKEKIAPLFPFGFGLSYTHFGYTDLKATAGSDGLEVSFKVTNAGSLAGDEVPQIYLGQPERKQAGEFPVHALAAFDRIHLEPGESKTVSIPVPRHRLEFWNTDAGKWTIAEGPRAVLVGGSSRDLPLTGKVDVP
jgi:beta-glucosidase